MGSVQSDVTSNVKAQIYAQNSEISKLVDMHGHGELIEIMKDPVLSKDTCQLDKEIRRKLLPYIYSEGRGEDMPILRLIKKRLSYNANSKRNNMFGSRMQISLSKRVCWDIDKRGAVGETPLHLCLLVGSTLHKELAKKMIRLFPGLVNDVYLSDEYYGENALHMAIVNEDPNMVRFLLSYNVDLHQRCCGKFFCPDDQKNGRQESLTQEYPSLPLETNYFGLSYYGEYPLSFAAIMHQIDCVKLLLAYGADPNKQDSNGNTVLHMLVIHNKLDVFENLLNHGARLDIRNRLGYSPIALAAHLCRKEILQFCLNKIGKVYWIYGDISCVAYPLDSIDTISENGRFDSSSVLYSIINTDTYDSLDLIDTFITNVLQAKWKAFIRKRFYIEFILYLIFFAFTSTAIIMKRMYISFLITSTNCTNSTSETRALMDECSCVYLYPEDPDRVARYTMESIVVIFALLNILLVTRQIYTMSINVFLRTLSKELSKALFIISCLGILTIIIFRVTCNPDVEDILTVSILICMLSRFVYFCRGFRKLAPIILVIQKMIVIDLTRFLLIYTVFLMAFSQAMYMVYDYGAETLFRTPIESIYDMMIISLGKFLRTYAFFDKSQYPALGKMLYVVYMTVLHLLLMNLIIAMLANTYSSINKAKKEWLRQWGKTIIALEQTIGCKTRLEYQKAYTRVLENGKRGLLVKWKQTNIERQNELMKEKAYFKEQIKKQM